jgi:hypothetical protein
MEMNFPHQRSCQETVTRQRHQALLAAAMMRQSSSPTAQALSQATRHGDAESAGCDTARRIHYFSSHIDTEFSPSGAFGTIRRGDSTADTTDESRVYQNALSNSNALPLDFVGTGEPFNQTGQH